MNLPTMKIHSVASTKQGRPMQIQHPSHLKSTFTQLVLAPKRNPSFRPCQRSAIAPLLRGRMSACCDFILLECVT